MNARVIKTCGECGWHSKIGIGSEGDICCKVLHHVDKNTISNDCQLPDNSALEQENAALVELLTDVCNSCMNVSKSGLFISNPKSLARRVNEALRLIQPCGHAVSEIVSGKEGTNYCAACERESKCQH